VTFVDIYQTFRKFKSRKLARVSLFRTRFENMVESSDSLLENTNESTSATSDKLIDEKSISKNAQPPSMSVLDKEQHMRICTLEKRLMTCIVAAGVVYALYTAFWAVDFIWAVHDEMYDAGQPFDMNSNMVGQLVWWWSYVIAACLFGPGVLVAIWWRTK